MGCHFERVDISVMIFVMLPLAVLLLLSGLTSIDCWCVMKSVTTISGTHASTGTICPGDLIFDEEFDTLRLDIWQHEINAVGKNFQWYTNNRSNSYTQDGVLHIRPTFLSEQYGEDFLYKGTLDINGGSPYDSCTNPAGGDCKKKAGKDIINPITSARIRSLYSFAFKYGRMEARAKVPAGDWLWPAIWLLPKWYSYSRWPASGEIDLMESRGNRQLYNYTNENIGVEQVGSTLHWGPYENLNRWRYTHFTLNNSTGFNADFHTYQLEWTPEYIKFFVDDNEIGKVEPPDGGFWEKGGFDGNATDNPWKGSSSKMAPFDQEFDIIINLAVGGVTFFSDSADNHPLNKPWLNNSTSPAADFWKGREQWMPTWNMEGDDCHFQIDYVKVWAL